MCCLQDNTCCPQDNTCCLQDNICCLQDNTCCLEDNTCCLEDNMSCLEDNICCLEDNICCLGDNMSYLDAFEMCEPIRASRAHVGNGQTHTWPTGAEDLRRCLVQPLSLCHVKVHFSSAPLRNTCLVLSWCCNIWSWRHYTSWGL